jgi:hypothetical protein
MTSSGDDQAAGSLRPQGTAAMPVLLGEALVQDAGLSREDLTRALAVARARGLRLGSALIELRLFSADDIAMALAQQHGVASARDKHLEKIDPATRARISPATEERLGAIAVALTHDEPPRLVVAMRDPRDASAIAALEAEAKLVVIPAVAAASRLDAIIRDATAARLLSLIRDAVPPRPTGIPLTGASPLLDLDALPQRATPWNAAARAMALEARRARATSKPPLSQPAPVSPAPSAAVEASLAPRGTVPPPVAEPPRGTTPAPIVCAPADDNAARTVPVPPPPSGTSVEPAARIRWRIAVAVAGLVTIVGCLAYVAYRLL